MTRSYYSDFWLNGGILTSPEWATRDAEDPRLERLESIEMGAWLELAEEPRAAVVELYAYRRPRLSRLAV